MHIGSYHLRQEEVKQFGLTDISVLEDEYGNGVVLNEAENGLLAGDVIMNRRNPYFSETDAQRRQKPRYIRYLTDRYNAMHAVRLAEISRARETVRLTTVVGGLALAQTAIPAMGDNPAGRERHARSLRLLIDSEARALLPAKQVAVQQVAGSIRLSIGTGSNVERLIGSKLDHAAKLLRGRLDELDEQGASNRQRQDDMLEAMFRDQWAAQRINELGKRAASAADVLAEFEPLARHRRMKPGVLNVNNARYRKDDPESLRRLITAQSGFEPLYGSMMYPLNRFNKDRFARITRDPAAYVNTYAELFGALEDAFDLIAIGGDYDLLHERLQAQLFETERTLLDEDFKSARRNARLTKFLLRYRAMPGEPVPPEWYLQPEPYEGDPFEGLS